jgi:hypothetical protein
VKAEVKAEVKSEAKADTHHTGTGSNTKRRKHTHAKTKSFGDGGRSGANTKVWRVSGLSIATSRALAPAPL